MKQLYIKHILIFCILLSALPILLNELLLYSFKDLSIPGALSYFVSTVSCGSICIGFGIYFIVRLFKQKIFNKGSLLLGLLVTIGTYTLAVITYNYRPLLSPLQFELLLFSTVLLFPTLTMIGVVLIKDRMHSVVAALLLCIVFCVAGFGLFTSSKSFTYTYENTSLLGRIRQAPYTYYLPSPKAIEPSRLQFTFGDVDFKKGVTFNVSSEGDNNVKPTYVAIVEKPRHISNPSTACGIEIVTTYLSDLVQPSSYKCTFLVESNHGSIYEIAYDVSSPDFEAAGEHIKEYLLITKDTYIYATYQTLSTQTPRIYDQNASIGLLQSMEPVQPEALLDRVISQQ